MSTLRTGIPPGAMTAPFVGAGFMVGGEAGMAAAFATRPATESRVRALRRMAAGRRSA